MANPTSATILARNRQDLQFVCNARQEGAALRHWRRRRGRARVVPVSATAAAIAIAATSVAAAIAAAIAAAKFVSESVK